MTLSPLDLGVMAAYALALLALGLWFARRASQSEKDYFSSGRSLSWWAAGTSMIAASFASDTPLLVTGYVRRDGVWANWEWWALGFSTVLSTFFFARLWHRSGVLTETELSEARYSGRPAAALRGVKAVFWGLFYASYAAGAGPATGLSKVLSVTLSWDRKTSIMTCAILAGGYVVFSGLWGVVTTGIFQCVAAVLGAVATSWYAVQAAGGWHAMLAAIPPGHLAIAPPMDTVGPHGLWDSHLAWVVAFFGIQWWAWKNSDAGAILVQRMGACKNERHAVGATLWYAVGQYALRAWPWVLAALASMVLFPIVLVDGKPDQEAAYAMLIAKVLPAGMRGFVLAWFLAEFMTVTAQYANFGASLLVHDGWKRFVRPRASEAEILWMARAASILVIAGEVVTACYTNSVVTGFRTLLEMTTGIGTVYLARWLWWRTNAMSEIAVLAATIPAVWLRPLVAARLGIPLESDLFRLLFAITACAMVWIPATLLTPPEPMDRLVAFYRKVRPPSWGWGPVAAEAGEIPREPWGRALLSWLLGTAGIYLMLFGLGGLVLGKGWGSLALLAPGAALIVYLVRQVRADS